MQDSIEDYVRISKNKKGNEPNTISKEVILTAEIKKNCHARAMKIVEFSIEGKLHPEVFLKLLPHIDQTYFQDIVEERAISKLCGYPICGKKIPLMPSKQYHISTKQNKVYDITERKNYCSNFCYKAGIHIKNQVDTSPLWLRKPDDVPKYKLLSRDVSGLPGVEVDQGIAKPVAEKSFTSVTSFTQFSLDDMIDDELGNKREQLHKTISKMTKTSVTQMETIKEELNNEGEQMKPEKAEICTENKPSIAKYKNTKKSDFKPELEMINEDKDETLTNKKKHKERNIKKSTKQKPSKISALVTLQVENHIKKCLTEWFTLETYIFIFGEDELKQKIADEKFMDFFNSLKISEDARIQEKRYIDICKKLHLKELADERFDQKLVGNASLEPLPDYKKLKEEGKKLDLKVKSFYGGTLYETEDPNVPLKNAGPSEDTNVEEGPPAVLPLIDNKSQTALRRKIFLTSARKAMTTLLQKLKTPSLSIISDLTSLVKTFELKADNIVFKPHMWNYISITLLKILSLKDKEIQKALETEQEALKYINLILSELPSSQGLINYAIDLIKNSDLLIKKYLDINHS